MISIVIPSRNEKFLEHTVNDILIKARGEIEVIIVLDGYWPHPPLRNDPRIKVIHRGEVRGLRNAVNSGVAFAQGEHILKCDAHCMFDEGFDIALATDLEDNWVVIPRRKRLDAENWQLVVDERPDVDYMYLSNPHLPDLYGRFPSMYGIKWDEKNSNEELKTKLIDETMMAQGSCWFMTKDYFYDLELMDEFHYGPFRNEFLEIGLKCWLSGGKVMCNKKTWYAHYHKNRAHRGYSLQKSTREELGYPMKWFNMGEAWPKQTVMLWRLLEKFTPIPGW